MGFSGPIIWALLVIFIGPFAVASLSEGISFNSLVSFRIYFTILGIIVGFIAALPIYLRYKSRKSSFIKLILTAIVLYPIFSLLLLFNLIWPRLQFPTPENVAVTQRTIYHQDTLGFGIRSRGFTWNLELSTDERLEKAKDIAKFYDNYAKEKGWSTIYYSGAIYTESCEAAVEKGFERLSSKPDRNLTWELAVCSYRGFTFGNFRESSTSVRFNYYGVRIP